MYGNNYFSTWPTYNTPQMQTPQQTPAIADDRIFVPSELAAKSYIMAPNSFVRLWDSSQPVFYECRTDPSGRSYPMEVYEYKRREQQTAPAAQNNTDYSAAIEKLARRIEKLENTRYVTTEEKEYDE